MESRFFDRDELTGDIETFHFDHTTDQFTIERVANVEPLMEVNKYIHRDTEDNWKGDMHRVASIPLVLLPELEKQGIMSAGGRILDAKKLKAWLNDSANIAFRTKLGRV